MKANVHLLRRTAASSSATLLLMIAMPGIAAPVLMISVDGLKPEYVFEAEKRDLKLPYLRSLLRSGTDARGVTGVWPTVTYPSHTTLVTGVSPAEHGILSNVEFDSDHHFKDAWFWYADQIRVPTLWRVTHAAHFTTASIGWPVTVGATDIDFLIPEYWRITAPTNAAEISRLSTCGKLHPPSQILGVSLSTAKDAPLNVRQ